MGVAHVARVIRSIATLAGLLGLAALQLACQEAPPAADLPDEPLGEAQAAQTVGQATSAGCATSAVEGLSKEVIARGNCIAPGAYVKLPSLPNVSYVSGVNDYLEQPARDAFVATANAHPGMSMTVNSMLRTLPQQYLLYHWYLSGTCGIALAATPGASNHETGLAFDTSQHEAWKSALQANGFHWFGSADVVHFDYTGSGATSYKGVDVRAFQQLWNEHHPEDLIDEDGIYGPATGARLAASPAGGFGGSDECPDDPDNAPDVAIATKYVDASDLYDDGASAGAVDLYAGDERSLQITFANTGEKKADAVTIEVDLDGAHLSTDDYLIESDWMNDGAFQENEANAASENPAHGADLGSSFTLQIHALSPGETKRVTLPISADVYSVDQVDSPSVRVFVKSIPDYYDQAAFGGEVDDHDHPVNFNGGRLEAAIDSDVYDRQRWEWDSNRREGWTASAGATVEVAEGALLLEGGSAGAAAIGPDTAFDAADAPVLTLSASRSGGSGDARLVFFTSAGEGIEETASFPLPDLAADGAAHEIRIDTATERRFTGTIHGLALVPFDGAAGSARLEYLRAGDGTVPTPPGTGDPGASVPVTDPDAEALDGCSCRIDRQGGGAGGSVLALGGLALVALSRRRRRR